MEGFLSAGRNTSPRCGPSRIFCLENVEIQRRHKAPQPPAHDSGCLEELSVLFGACLLVSNEHCPRSMPPDSSSASDDLGARRSVLDAVPTVPEQINYPGA